ncbi:hypothetical protein B9479_007073 [Cryptococcus floricola]|uniref:HMG domain-containing protein n=1 Tax=Cryptococcus floricola TaxID=2591691 RepID=A0A5D3ALD6_9TREE|nr:hypothetical protein B9479_007073 [Cryptococcus floricola]
MSSSSSSSSTSSVSSASPPLPPPRPPPVPCALRRPFRPPRSLSPTSSSSSSPSSPRPPRPPPTLPGRPILGIPGLPPSRPSSSSPSSSSSSSSSSGSPRRRRRLYRPLAVTAFTAFDISKRPSNLPRSYSSSSSSSSSSASSPSDEPDTSLNAPALPPPPVNWRARNLEGWRARNRQSRHREASPAPASGRAGRAGRAGRNRDRDGRQPIIVEPPEDVQPHYGGDDGEIRRFSDGEPDFGQNDAFMDAPWDLDDFSHDQPEARSVSPVNHNDNAVPANHGAAMPDVEAGLDNVSVNDDAAEEGDDEPWTYLRDGLRDHLLHYTRMWEWVWLLPDWNKTRNVPLPTFCHLQALYGERTCDCSAFRRDHDCVHVRLLDNDRGFLETLPNRLLAGMAFNPVVLVSLRHDDNADYHLVYSVQQSGHDPYAMQNQGRRVVVYRFRHGGWTCSQRGRGCRNLCPHITRARENALDAGLIDDDQDMGHEAADQENVGGGGGDGDDDDGDDLPNGEEGDEVRDACQHPIKAMISHEPRPPPASLSLDSDELNPSFPNARSLDGERHLLELDTGSRCRCGYLLSSRPDLREQAVERDFTLYHMDGCEPFRLQVTKCPRAACQRFIGPDLGSKGLINFNNDFGFTRNIFDSYIALATLGEVTIHSFHRYLISNYTNMQATDDIKSISTFTRCLFAFLKLVQWGNTMKCPVCGDHPEVVIMDGTVIPFSYHYLTGNMRPATIPTSESVDRYQVAYTPLSALNKEILGLTGANFIRLRREMYEWSVELNGRGMKPLPPSLIVLFDHDAPRGLTPVDHEVFNSLQAFIRLILDPGDLSLALQRRLRVFLGQLFTPDIITCLFPPQTYQDLARFSRTGETTFEMRKMATVITPVIETCERQFGNLPYPPLFLRIVGSMNSRSRSLLDRLKERASHERGLPEDVMARVRVLELQERSNAVAAGDRSGLKAGWQRCSSRPIFSGIPPDAGIKRLHNGD